MDEDSTINFTSTCKPLAINFFNEIIKKKEDYWKMVMQIQIFFHIYTIIYTINRGCKNKIQDINYNIGNWVFYTNAISNTILSEFQKIYIIELIHNKITEFSSC